MQITGILALPRCIIILQIYIFHARKLQWSNTLERELGAAVFILWLFPGDRAMFVKQDPDGSYCKQHFTNSFVETRVYAYLEVHILSEAVHITL